MDPTTHYLIPPGQPIVPVLGMEADLTQYYSNTYVYRYVDYQVATEYVDPHTYHLIIRRLDGGLGSTDHLQVMVCDYISENCTTLAMDPWSGCFDCVRKITTKHTIHPDTDHPRTLPQPRPHPPDPPPQYRTMTREQFNEKFNTDIVTLPASLFAIGRDEYQVHFMYHEGNGPHSIEYKNIRAPVEHLLWVLEHHPPSPRPGPHPPSPHPPSPHPPSLPTNSLTPYHSGKSDPSSRHYFIISSTDGYLENTYQTPHRTTPRQVGPTECQGRYLPPTCQPHEYPVFHHRQHVLAQSVHINLPYAVPIPDRHFFFHNLNHPFRSFHQGILWDTKIPKMVFAAQDRDTKYNFLDPRMRELNIAPRKYFKTQVAPRYPDIIEYNGGWMDRTTMVIYKYILDIDGAASTWDATAWKLNSGSVIFKPRSGWAQWFYDGNPLYHPDQLGFKANVHYIEIRDDFSDLRDKYLWCENHPTECRKMIKRCRDLFQEVYSYQRVIEYTQRVIDEVILTPSPPTSPTPPTSAPPSPPTPPPKVTLRDHESTLCLHNSSTATTLHPRPSTPVPVPVPTLAPAPPSTIHQYIDHVFYINLASRPDRRQQFETQATLYGISYERFDAIPHTFGIVGCTRSHQAVYRLAQERQYKNVLIFEDDFEFLVPRQVFEQEIAQIFAPIPTATSHAPHTPLDPPMDVCMLAYNLNASEPSRSPHLLRVYDAQTASAYIVNASYLPTLIDLYDAAIPLLERTREHWKYANDQAWKVLQYTDGWYCTKTRIGKQRDGYSDNAREFMSYNC